MFESTGPSRERRLRSVSRQHSILPSTSATLSYVIVVDNKKKKQQKTK